VLRQSPPQSHHCERQCRPEKIRHARAPGLYRRNRHDRNLIELASHGFALPAARLGVHRRAPCGCRRSCGRFLRTGVLRLGLLSVFHLRPTPCDAVCSAAVHTAPDNCASSPNGDADNAAALFLLRCLPRRGATEGGLLELDHPALRVITHLAFEVAEVVIAAVPRQPYRPHRLAAVRARRLKRKAGPFRSRTWLCHRNAPPLPPGAHRSPSHRRLAHQPAGDGANLGLAPPTSLSKTEHVDGAPRHDRVEQKPAARTTLVCFWRHRSGTWFAGIGVASRPALKLPVSVTKFRRGKQRIQFLQQQFHKARGPLTGSQAFGVLTLRG
jgi:hypothetical protein